MTQTKPFAKKKETCRILQHEALASGIFDLRVESSLAEGALPGQFAGLYVPNSAKLLPRPISICDADAKSGSLRFVYRVTKGLTGASADSKSGTEEIATLKVGDTIDVLGLLGNGYDLRTAEGKQPCLLGGGIGVPPMLYLAKRLAAERSAAGTNTQLTLLMGYRNAETFLADEFRQYGSLLIATDDGSVGTKGTVMDILKSVETKEDAVYYACGPKPMLKALKEYTLSPKPEGAEAAAPKVFVSLEERMACGVGVCLGCVTETVHTDSHSRVRNARICTEGPVFDAAEAVL